MFIVVVIVRVACEWARSYHIVLLHYCFFLPYHFIQLQCLMLAHSFFWSGVIQFKDVIRVTVKSVSKEISILQHISIDWSTPPPLRTRTFLLLSWQCRYILLKSWHVLKLIQLKFNLNTPTYTIHMHKRYVEHMSLLNNKKKKKKQMCIEKCIRPTKFT